MNTDPENFDQLKKLLAWKRHEQPPPGFFDSLPAKVWTRIDRQKAQPSFWERLIPSFGLKPAVAYAFGLVVCGTLIIGIGSTLKTEGPADLAKPMFTGPATTALPMSPVGLAEGKTSVAPDRDVSSTNPVINTAPLYPGPVRLDVHPTGFKPQNP
jgi:hypothetical protein